MSKTFELETLKIKLTHDELSSLDIHVRIQKALRSLILDGMLESGVKLPGSRLLAKSLGVARDTVESAYTQLHRDGYIVRQSGAGTYVSATMTKRLKGGAPRSSGTHHPTNDPLNPPLSGRGRALWLAGGWADPVTVRALVPGVPETRSFPVHIWEKIQRQVLRDHRNDALLYGDPQGRYELRCAISTYLNLERGGHVSPEQILILNSTRQALYLCSQLLMDAGDHLFMEDPGYGGANKVFQSAHINRIPITVDEDGLKVEHLIQRHREGVGVYITPSHQYPTGVTLTLARRLELIRWAATHEKWIIEDDYDSEFHYDGLPTACVQGLDKEQRTIYIGTFSKTLYPGIRVGYMVLPPTLVRPFTYARSVMDGHTSQIVQLSLARFMEEGHYNSYIKTMKKVYKERRRTLQALLDKYLSEVVSFQSGLGGLQLSCVLKPGWTEAQTLERAQTVGISLAGLSHFYSGECLQEGWLLGYAGQTPYELEQSILSLHRSLYR